MEGGDLIGLADGQEQYPMKIDPNDPRYVFMTEADVLKAGGSVDAIRNRWWSVHPEKGLRFWQSMRGRQGKLEGASPQCNSNEEIVLSQGDEVKFIPLVLAPINVSDYGN